MQKAVKELLKLNIKSRADLMLAKRKISKKYGIKILQNSDILKYYKKQTSGGKMKREPRLERILRKRAVRTLSGVAPVAVLTKPFACPANCAYCPTEKNVPKSYLSNEPAVMRAIRCGYNPYKQVQLRLRALEANGHEPAKIELIVIGGTWSALPEKYKYWYIANLFAGANKFQFPISNFQFPTKLQIPISKPIKDLKKILNKEQRKNEKAKYKIVGLTLETRPDYINEKELLQMRELGCTRVELGTQAIDDKILKKNKRGHGVGEITKATKLLKNFGFKVAYHIMPGLPGASPAKDLKMFKQLFSDERFQPDQIKLYPVVVTSGSLLYRWWRTGKYKPYTDKQLQKLIIACKNAVPEYTRIIRLIRDIPSESIAAGNMITNLRQIMKDGGVKCRCIRCREVRGEKLKAKNKKLKVIKYNASGGQEYFLQYTSNNGKVLFGFCRLRLPFSPPSKEEREAVKNLIPPPTTLSKGSKGGIILSKGGEERFVLYKRGELAAIIRELHIYGELVPVGKNKVVQHAGLGKKLMATAEKIAREQGYQKIAVISGVGVRGYYRKLGYRLRSGYMIKKL